MSLRDRTRQIKIEIIGVELLEDYDLALYPLSVKEFADRLGIHLSPYHFLTEEARRLAPLASRDAFAAYDSSFTSCHVAYDGGAYRQRSRFSCFHEIGHIVLEHDPKDPMKEDEADYFAGYLLTPHPLVRACKTPQEVERRFGVSGNCAGFAWDQMQRRWAEQAPLRPHEKWLLKNVAWRGGDPIDCA